MPQEEPKKEESDAEKGKKIYRKIFEITKKAFPDGFTKTEGKPVEFGNNFYSLFEALKEGKTDYSENYLARAEAYGEKWENFLKKNSSLINDINKALEQRKIHIEVMDLFMKLQRNPKTRHLAEVALAEINPDDMRVAVLNNLNPLLEQASKAMRECKINPEEFYGNT